MATLPLNASIEEIDDELIVQETMLESLGEDDNETRAEIERTISELKERLDSYQPSQSTEEGTADEDMSANNHFRPGSVGGNHTQYSLPEVPGAFPTNFQNGQQPQNGFHNDPRLQNGFPYSSAMYIPNPSYSAGFKRPHQASSPDPNEARAKRLTPNPSGSEPTSRSHTPSHMGSQVQSTQDRRAAWVERQRHIAETANKRRESEMADAELAASLMAHNASSPIAGPSHSRPMPQNHMNMNTVSRNTTSPSQWAPVFRPPGYSAFKQEPSYSGFKREQPPSPSPYAAAPSTNYHGMTMYNAPGYPVGHPAQHSAHLNAYSASPAPQQVKSEPSRPNMTLPNRPSRQTAVVDLTASDDDDVVELPNYKPSYPMPGQWNNNVMAQQHQRLSGGHVYPPMPGMPNRANMTPSLYDHLERGRGDSNRIKDELTELSHLVRGRGLDSDDDNFGPSPWGGYNPREDAGLDPEATRAELRKLMENIQPEDDDTNQIEQDVPIPGMTVKLKPYQATGLKWLQKMESGNNKGGILADDMGLGKTVQAISLMVTRRSEEPLNKTTLIIAPVALLRQWNEEIAQKIRPGTHRLSTFLHHSSSKKKTHRELRQFDVVLTTFGTLATEMKKMDSFNVRKQADPNAQPRDDEKCLFIGPLCHWYRVIVDEAQCIKNRTTRTAKAAYHINARSRFCLTGTPMMNGVEELFSLVRFIGIKPYDDWSKFNLDFVKPLKSPNEQFRDTAMRKFQALLKAILLRRNKQTKANGRPILTLPERVIEQTHAVFSKDEREYYDALEGKHQIQFNKYLKAGTVGRSYAHILLLLLRLRQACCHPHLIKDFGVAAAADISTDVMEDLCRTLTEDVIRRIKEADGNFECPICFDAVENPAIFVPCGHKTCTECFTRIADPAQGVVQGEENAGRTSKCPECRNPINTKSIVDYECFKKIHMAEPVVEDQPDEAVEEEEDDDGETDSDMSSDSDSDSDDEDDATLGGFIVKDDVDSQASTESEAETDSDEEDKKDIIRMKQEQIAQKKAKAKAEKKKAKAKMSANAKGKRKMKKSKYSLAELKKLAGTSKKHKKKYMEKVRKDYIPSAKIEKTMEIVKGIMDAAEGEKIIIFSQWTSLLDLLEIDVDGKHYGYRRYDGSMNAKQRGDAVEDFKTKPSVRMMLVSLKAGNAGLNLNIASQVIILDPFWNPYIEEQAIDRAHRLGQNRPVHVHRILVEETVEDRILALQEKKRAVISEALDEKASKGVSRLSPRELAYLFGVNRNIDDPLNIPHGGH